MRFIMVMIAILLVALAGIISFIVVSMVDQGVTGAAVIREYSYTKAICDETKCQDYEIVCNGKNIISRTTIQGAVIYHSSDWVDPRSEKTIYTFCQ